MESTGISWQNFDTVNDLKARVILLADTCHSGSIKGNERLKERAQVGPSQYLREANRSNVPLQEHWNEEKRGLEQG